MAVNQSRKDCPKGFLCSGVRAGIKEEPRKDLGLICTTSNAIAGGVFTQNRFPAAHVQYCKPLVPTGNFRALIVNSGNANAATGQAGIEANYQMASTAANALKVDPRQVFTSSTGIIGRPFPIEQIEEAIPGLVRELNPTLTALSEAILTTDTAPKTAFSTLQLGEDTYTIAGVAKGSGMIHPNMATLLAYIMTDAPMPINVIQKITERVVDSSFNSISVDGDTSTNDSFFIISSNPVEDLDPEALATIEQSIGEVAVSLAKQIAADGEGAEHLLEVTINEAPSDEIADSVLKMVLTSSLVKTAVHGKDPNWGRLLMAVGNGLAPFKLENNLPISISIQSIPVFLRGEPVVFDEQELVDQLGEFEVTIHISLHQGAHAATGWGCDLSHGYISINADYST